MAAAVGVRSLCGRRSVVSAGGQWSVVSGQWSLAVTQRGDRPDGRVVGGTLVAMEISAYYFFLIYSTIALSIIHVHAAETVILPGFAVREYLKVKLTRIIFPMFVNS